MDDVSLKECFTKEQLIELIDTVLDTQIELVRTRADNLGISIATTGSINPKHYNTHRRLFHDIGLKVWIPDDKLGGM